MAPDLHWTRRGPEHCVSELADGISRRMHAGEALATAVSNAVGSCRPTYARPEGGERLGGRAHTPDWSLVWASYGAVCTCGINSILLAYHLQEDDKITWARPPQPL